MSNRKTETREDSLSLQQLEQIDAISEAFESAWKNELSHDLEDFVSRVEPALQTALLRELLAIEIDYRRQQGLAVECQVLADDYPSLSNEIGEWFSEIKKRANLRVDTDSTVGLASTATPTSKLTIRCPHCHAPFEVAAETAVTDITCDACGSHFNLAADGSSTRQASTIANIAHFELIDRIGIGGFGTVWKARDTELDRTVALKTPHSGKIDSAQTEKFLREARAAAQLRHPNIVSVHEVGRDGETLYIVGDLVRGVSLNNWLTAHQPTAREAAKLFAKIVRALHHAHEKGVIHRDLKPANIMIDGQTEPHIMDFGLARREVGEVTMTVDGQILGTPAYMSPEQAQGEGHVADRRTDIYSMGVIFFELLTGERPFRGNAQMLMHQVIHDEPPNPRKLNSNVPRDLDTICCKCMEKNPTQRYDNAQVISDELQCFLDGKPIQARPITRAGRSWRWCKKNPAVSTLALLLLVAVVVGVGGILTEASRRIRAEFFSEKTQQIIDDYFTGQSGYYGPSAKKIDRSLLIKAVEAYRQVVATNPNDLKSKRKFADSLLRLSDASRSNGLTADALNEAKEALSIISDMYDTTSTDKDLASLAIAWERVGLAESGDDAVQSFKRAYELNSELTKLTGEASYEFHAGLNCFNLGFALNTVSKRAEAIEWLRRSIELLDHASIKLKNDGQVVGLQAYSRELLASILQAEKPDESITLLKRAVMLRQMIIENHDETTQSLAQLAEAYNRLGLTQQGQNKTKDALESLLKSVETREKIVDFQLAGDEFIGSTKQLLGACNNFSRNEMSKTMALELFERLRSLDQSLMPITSNNFDVQDRYRLAATYFNTGANLEAQRDKGKAMTCYDRSVELYQIVVDSGEGPDRNEELAYAIETQRALKKFLDEQ